MSTAQAQPKPTREQIYKLLEEVKDPEIPVISLIDLGCITEVDIRKDGQVFVEMVPTFSGCPAQRIMLFNIQQVLEENGITNHEVTLNSNRSWTSNNITQKGRKILLDFGLSPPPAYDGELDDDTLEKAMCPHCHSTNTKLINPFGPSLCRAVHKCNDCKETFEQFKPL